jgi:hypothetical protein
MIVRQVFYHLSHSASYSEYLNHILQAFQHGSFIPRLLWPLAFPEKFYNELFRLYMISAEILVENALSLQINLRTFDILRI